MREKDRISGFEIIRMRENAELGGTLWEMRHMATGAQLLWLDNKESNKLCSIAFGTLPEDDTGVFHILEHAVLNGSRQFPVKEPFVEMLKGSMYTFLNAMTLPDKTVFPVSSRNEQDFLNLTRVYLDAVLFPSIYHNPCIFEQEGWHYEFEEDTGLPSYNGVVFNEMQGACSSPDLLLNTGLKRLLYPDCCYRFSPGGDPAHIPELGYEAFLNAHRANYHPANAYVYLDGDVPLEKVLTLLDGSFNSFASGHPKPQVLMQPSVPHARAEGVYEGAEQDGAMLGLGKIIGSWRDRKRIMEFLVLAEYLTGSNEAPLKKAILESRIAEDAEMFADDGIAQPYLALQVRRMDSSRSEELLALIRDTISNVDRINPADVLAIIDAFAFSAHDGDEPKGLARNIGALNTWFFGGDPLDGMTVDALFDALRAQAETGYFDRLVSEMDFFGDNTAMYTLLPSPEKGEEAQKEQTERLRQASALWTQTQRDALAEQNRVFLEWQNRADSPEALRTLPVLTLADIKPVSDRLETCVSDILDTTVLYHKSSAMGITHFHLYFSLADCTVEQLQQLSFQTNLLGGLPTAKHSAADLEREKKSRIGFLDYNLTVYPDRNNPDICTPYLAVSFSALTQHEADAVSLVAEILRDTDYGCRDSRSRIEQILRQGKESLFQNMIASGNRYAITRASSHFCAAAAVSEKTEGYDFYRFLCDFADNFDERIEAFRQTAQRLAQTVFVAGRMTVSVTCVRQSAAAGLLISLLQGEAPAKLPSFMLSPPDKKAAAEAIVIPAAVSYAASCGTLQHFGAVYDGGMDALSQIMNYHYLWNEIRVKGGAYGCGFHITENGSICFSSYRDPSPAGSLCVFGSSAAFLRKFCARHGNIDSYIIGALTLQNPLLHDRDKAWREDRDYIMQISAGERECWQKQLLGMKRSGLLPYTAWLERKETGYADCIIGSRDALSACDQKQWKFLELK